MEADTVLQALTIAKAACRQSGIEWEKLNKETQEKLTIITLNNLSQL